jgi:hypothetical protein
VRFAVLLALVAVAGCGGDSSKPRTVDAAPPKPPRVRALEPRPADVALIRRWADTLRAGRVSAASRLFATPAIAENGTGELLLRSPAEARLFNGSLPCGAVLVDAKRVKGGYTIGVFRLTDRPGGDCAQGTGQKAATAFSFKRGRIKEWRRVPVPEFAPAQPSPQV